MKKKFKIMYPKDYYDEGKRGKPYHPPTGCMVVMNGGGAFFLYISVDPKNPTIQKLSTVLYNYDVIWKEL